MYYEDGLDTSFRGADDFNNHQMADVDGMTSERQKLVVQPQTILNDTRTISDPVADCGIRVGMDLRYILSAGRQ